MTLQLVFWISVGWVALSYAGYPLAVWVLGLVYNGDRLK